MDDKDLLHFNAEISYLRFELNRCRVINKELSASLADLQKENIKLREDIDNFFCPIGDYFNSGDISITETVRQAPFSFLFAIKLPDKIFMSQRAPSDLQDRIEIYFDAYLDREILPRFKQICQELLHKTMKYEGRKHEIN
jgi:hypothetical protein